MDTFFYGFTFQFLIGEGDELGIVVVGWVGSKEQKLAFATYLVVNAVGVEIAGCVRIFGRKTVKEHDDQWMMVFADGSRYRFLSFVDGCSIGYGTVFCHAEGVRDSPVYLLRCEGA